MKETRRINEGNVMKDMKSENTTGVGIAISKKGEWKIVRFKFEFSRYLF